MRSQERLDIGNALRFEDPLVHPENEAEQRQSIYRAPGSTSIWASLWFISPKLWIFACILDLTTMKNLKEPRPLGGRDSWTVGPQQPRAPSSLASKALRRSCNMEENEATTARDSCRGPSSHAAPELTPSNAHPILQDAPGLLSLRTAFRTP